MLRCGATFDENCAPLWDKGDFRGVERGTNPLRRCDEGDFHDIPAKRSAS